MPLRITFTIPRWLTSKIPCPTYYTPFLPADQVAHLPIFVFLDCSFGPSTAPSRLSDPPWRSCHVGFVVASAEVKERRSASTPMWRNRASIMSFHQTLAAEQVHTLPRAPIHHRHHHHDRCCHRVAQDAALGTGRSAVTGLE